MIIFTGTGYSGTGMYSKLFSTHHEYRVERLVRRIRALPGAAAPQHDLLRDPALRRDLMAEHLRGVELRSFRDSSNPYVHLADALWAADQNCRIVLGVRDGREFVRTAISRGHHLPDGHRRPHTFRTLFHTIARLSGRARGRFSGFMFEPERSDPWHSQWSALGAVGRMAWLWQYRNRKALERLQSVPTANWTVTRLEDLTRDPSRTELQRLESFVGVPAEPKWLTERHNQTSQHTFPHHSEWSADTLAEFERIAGPLMRQFGYWGAPS